MEARRILKGIDVADVTFEALAALRSGAEKILATFYAGDEPCFLYVHDASDVTHLQNRAKEGIISNVEFRTVIWQKS